MTMKHLPGFATAATANRATKAPRALKALKAAFTLTAALTAAITATLITTLSSCSPGGEPTIPNTAPLTLSVDKPVIKTDGVDRATFKVMQGEENVTGRALIRSSSTDTHLEPGNPVFTTRESGLHEYYACFAEDIEGTKSNIVQVYASADGSVKFQKNIVFHTFTGTWCQHCHTNKTGINTLKKGFGDRVQSINFYDSRSNPLVVFGDYSTFANQMGGLGYGVGSLPVSVVDMKKYLLGGKPYSEFLAAYNQFSVGSAMTGISVDSRIEDGKVKVSVEVYAETENAYSINAFLVEDNIVCEQSTPTTVIQEYNHTDIVRKAAVNKLFGEELGTNAAGQTVTKEFTFDLLSRYKPEDLSVTVCTAYDDAGDERSHMVIANTVKCPANGSVGYKFAK
jgi:hypothetical protein